MKKRFLKMFGLGFKKFNDPYYQGFAAQVAFYFTLSLVPILVLVSQILSVIFQQDLDKAVGWMMDSFGNNAITSQLQPLIAGSSGTTTTGIVFFIVAVWAASRAQFALMRIANFTYDDADNTFSEYWTERFRSLKTMILTLITIVFAMIVMIYGKPILTLILKLVGADASTGKIWLIIRWPIAILLYFVMLSLNYKVLPKRKLKFKEVIPGSIFASVGLLIVTIVYSNYATNIANYNLVYGSLSTIVALLFWFYFLAWVLFLGILINKVWLDTAEN